MENIYDVIIIGSGPAGLTAAIYTTRAGLKTLIVAGAKWGGQLQLTTEVDNFPGFPDGIQGPELMLNMRKQAERFGTEILEENFIEGDFFKPPFTVKTVSKQISGKAVILATGADTKWLDVPGEKERIGRGISSCAPCDAPFFRNKNVIVVGGGDSAMEEALVMTRFATHVWVIYRGDTLRASKIMQEKAYVNEKITFVFNTIIEEIMGENKVERVRLSSKFKDQSAKVQIKMQNKDLGTTPEEIGGKRLRPEDDQPLAEKTEDQRLEWEFPIDGIFVAIGHIPNTSPFKGIELDEKGYIKVRDHYHTNIEGVFTAGDVHDKQYMQAVTAAGHGCAAALEVEKWLEMQKEG